MPILTNPGGLNLPGANPYGGLASMIAGSNEAQDTHFLSQLEEGGPTATGGPQGAEAAPQGNADGDVLGYDPKTQIITIWEDGKERKMTKVQWNSYLDQKVKSKEMSYQDALNAKRSPPVGRNATSGRASGGSTGGSSGGKHSYGAAWGGGGGGGTSSSNPYGAAPPAAAGGAAGQTSVNWNDPLGFKNPGAGPGFVPGQGQTGGFAYGKPQSIFQGLPSNPTLGDVVGSTIRRQEENRDAALNTLGSARGEIMNDPLRAAMRGQTASLLANPYSMDPATVSKMKGQQQALITGNASRLEGMAKDRAAQQGTLGSGVANASVDSIRNSALGQLANAYSGIDVQAAIQNKQDQRSALGAALPGIAEDTSSRNNLDLAAARDVLGGSQFYGDAFLSQMLLGKNGGNGGGGNLYNPYNGGYVLQGGPLKAPYG